MRGKKIVKIIDRFHHLSLQVTEKIENTKVNPVILFLYMALLLSLREFFEQSFFSQSFRIPVYVHHLFFGMVIFLAGTLILSYWSRSDLRFTTRIVSAGIMIIVLPPLIDRFLFLRHSPYDYLQPAEFLTNLLTFCFHTQKAGIGILIEILLIISLASYYVLLKTQSLWRSFCCAGSIYLLTMIAATPNLFMPLPRMKTFILLQNPHVYFSLFFFFLALLLGILFIWSINRRLPRALFYEWFSLRSLHFMMMTGAGFFLTKGFAFLAFPDVIFFAISISVINLLWLSTVLLNNVYDLPIDAISNANRPLPRGEVTTVEYVNLSFILAFVAFFLSMLSGTAAEILVVIFILSSLIYSAPPFRLRRRLFSSVFIGWGSALAFLIGYWNRTKIVEVTLPLLPAKIVAVIFVSFSIGSLTKDLKDYNGDIKNGIRNLCTVYGYQTGKRIITGLLCFSLLTPIFIFQQSFDLIFIIFSAIFSSTLFYASENYFYSFLGYGMTFIYCAFRYLNLI